MSLTQCMMVLHHMEQEGSITPKEAFEEYGIMRLGARIYDLKMAGYPVKRIMVTDLNRYGQETRFARYYLGRP